MTPDRINKAVTVNNVTSKDPDKSEKLNQLVEDLSLKKDLKQIEAYSFSVLENLGFKTHWPDILSAKYEQDSLAHVCKEAVFYAHAGLDHIHNGNFSDLAWCALRAGHYSALLDFKINWERTAIKGLKSLKNSGGSRDNRPDYFSEIDAKHSNWQTLAEKYFKRNPNHSKSDAARCIQNQTGDPWNTVRLKIAKPD